MRDARLNHAGDLDGVRPGKAATPARKGRPSRKPAAGAVRSKTRAFRGRALATVASAVFAALMCGIVLNATVFQKGHHPAPLFGSAADSMPPPPTVRAAVPMQPPQRTAAVETPATAAAPAELHTLSAAPAAAIRSSVPVAAARLDHEAAAHERAAEASPAAHARLGQPSATAGRTASARTDRSRLAAMMAAAASR